MSHSLPECGVQPPLRNLYSRSPVYSTKGICSSSQPLATAIGVQILAKGGTAADAAVAMAAALNVTEPCSTGIGGDAFALYYEKSSGKVTCLQGNGATSSSFTLEMLRERGISLEGKPLDPHSALCVTVPGAPMLWEDLVKKHGSMPLSEVLAPAARLARDGFPVGPVTSRQWSTEFLQGPEAMRVFRPNGTNPKPGDLFSNPDLAATFDSVGSLGAKEGFYKGRIAQAIVSAIAEFGGVLSLDDLANHETAFEAPVSAVYRGIRLYETPPPTHGVAALQALLLMEKLKSSRDDGLSAEELRTRRGSADEAHLGIECMRLAFCDALKHCCDPRHRDVPLDVLLSDEYISKRAEEINSDTSNSAIDAGDITAFTTPSDTVYFACVDPFGNACSMINSNYQGFGVGIVPTGCGFTLQNRGFNFSLEPGHANVAAPRKRPYHTIIPGLAVRESDQSFFCTFGNMGGFMQPQGHAQIMRNLIEFKMDPQSAVDAPKWFVCGAGTRQDPSDVRRSVVKIEEGYGGDADGGIGEGADELARELRARGHEVLPIVRGYDRYIYGRGQIIFRDAASGVLIAGSDPRADGCAMPLV